MLSDSEFLKAIAYKLTLTADLPLENGKKILSIFEKTFINGEFNIILQAPVNLSVFQFACYLDRFVNPGVVNANRLLAKQFPVLGLSVYAADGQNTYRIVGRVSPMPEALTAMSSLMRNLAGALTQIERQITREGRNVPEESFFKHICESNLHADTPEHREEVKAFFSGILSRSIQAYTHVPYSLYRLASWIGSDIEYRAEQSMEQFYKDLERTRLKEATQGRAAVA